MSTRHKDKYRSKVEGADDRRHRKANGVLKRPYYAPRAKRIAARMNERYRTTDIAAYPCPVCPFWHVGNRLSSSPEVTQ